MSKVNTCGAQEALKKKGVATPTGQTGRRAWGDKNVNIVLGCPNRCRYCYARAMARATEGFAISTNGARRISDCGKGAWLTSTGRFHGTVRFPTTHDITPEFLEECVAVIRNLLMGGNRVTVCSKPRLDCIRRLCREFADNREALEFRFTIGAMDDDILRFWEPGAQASRSDLTA